MHRDVKPANALLAAQDHVYLTDFGLTKRAASGSAMTKTGQLVGTVDYVAPEQVEGGSVDARTDVYSLACVFYHLLTGRVPFDKPTEMAKLFAHVHEDPPRPSDAVAGLPGPVDDVIWRGMAKDHEERSRRIKAQRHGDASVVLGVDRRRLDLPGIGMPKLGNLAADAECAKRLAGFLFRIGDEIDVCNLCPSMDECQLRISSQCLQIGFQAAESVNPASAE